MKTKWTIVAMILITTGSIAFGIYQYSTTDRAFIAAERAVEIAEAAQAEAIRQEVIATSSMAEAGRQARIASEQRAAAESAVAECNRNRRK